MHTEIELHNKWSSNWQSPGEVGKSIMAVGQPISLSSVLLKLWRRNRRPHVELGTLLTSLIYSEVME